MQTLLALGKMSQWALNAQNTSCTMSLCVQWASHSQHETLVIAVGCCFINAMSADSSMGPTQSSQCQALAFASAAMKTHQQGGQATNGCDSFSIPGRFLEASASPEPVQTPVLAAERAKLANFVQDKSSICPNPSVSRQSFKPDCPAAWIEDLTEIEAKSEFARIHIHIHIHTQCCVKCESRVQGRGAEQSTEHQCGDQPRAKPAQDQFAQCSQKLAQRWTRGVEQNKAGIGLPSLIPRAGKHHMRGIFRSLFKVRLLVSISKRSHGFHIDHDESAAPMEKNSCHFVSAALSPARLQGEFGSVVNSSQAAKQTQPIAGRSQWKLRCQFLLSPVMLLTAGMHRSASPR
jgi:hypothetical protein